MSDANILSIIGLIFDIVGACLLFKYGLPSNMYNRPLTKEEKIYDKLNKEARKKRNESDTEHQFDELDKKHMNKLFNLSHIALFLLIMGFVLQLFAQFPAFTNNKKSTRSSNCATNKK